MNASAPPTPSPYRSLLGIAVIALLGLLATAGFKSYRDLAAARLQEAHLEAQIDATEAHIRSLEHRLRLLENDTLTLERLAREELGLAHPEDVVIVLPPGLGPVAEERSTGP